MILPGPEGSDFAFQDFRSDVGVVRVRRDIGQSFVRMLATSREIEGGAHNRLAGQNFQWRHKPTHTFTGQILWSDSRTPVRANLASEWDGRALSDRAMVVNWSHNTPHFDWFMQGQDLGREFRAEDGIIPQVGCREGYLQTGYTFRPKQAFLNRIRVFNEDYVDMLPGDDVLTRHLQIGAVRPGDHRELRAAGSLRWLDVHDGPASSGRLFSAQAERLRTTYTFNARSFLRVIAQHVRTDRNPALHTFAVGARRQDVSLSGLFAYKLNWQTVLYAGYGDERAFANATGSLEKSGRQAYAKLSYAWLM